ncbi:hypothetical protein OAV62_01710 [bacterium]|nr:hypothetical protein [bacterium]
MNDLSTNHLKTTKLLTDQPGSMIDHRSTHTMSDAAIYSITGQFKDISKKAEYEAAV